MPRKSILFNALGYSPTGAGVSRYVRELALELASLRDDLQIAAQSGDAAASFPKDRTLTFPKASGSNARILMEQLWLPLKARRFSLAHYPDCAVPALRPWPVIVTCHDLSFITCQGTFTKAQTLWKRSAARRAAKYAKAIVCDSQCTANDFRSIFGIAHDRVSVVHPGHRPYDGLAVKPSCPLPSGNFILAVGTLEPRKNYVRLISAIESIRRQGIDVSLVIAGRKGWLYQDILDKICSCGLTNHIFLPGFCSEGELRWLYEHASALAYVSLYEGFGFPPLEAMSRRLPVVAARVSSIPEVCGAAASYVDPLSETDIAARLAEVITRQDLRTTLISAGEAQFRRFDWHRTATSLSALYDRLL